ncbi:MAG: hypothetical protein ACR2M3_06050 [Thermomicrobiales bacterium]
MGTRQHDAMVEIEGGLAQEERAKRLTLKRRGLIAGAAALAAGVLAKQAADPQIVSAHDPDDVWINHDVSSVSVTSITADPNYSQSSGTVFLSTGTPARDLLAIYGRGSGNAAGVQGDGGSNGGIGVLGNSTGANADGVRGNGTGNNAGVSGIAGNNGGPGVIGFGGKQGSAPAIGAGVIGTTFGFVPGPGQNAGVYGQSNVDGTPGVFGHAFAGNTNGVTGSGANGGVGVFGINSNAAGIGVQGFNDHGPAVQGNTSEGTGVKGIATSGTGVSGASASGTGVYGSTTNGFFGVFGAAGTPAGAAGVLGYSGTANGTAFGSVVVAPATIAGYFNGEVHVEGPFYVDPISNKHGVIAHPDGSKRVFYSMEAPESWVEDFGRDTLAGGKAEVRLDADFAAVVHTDDYHVFVTPQTDTKGLYIAARGATGFTVREQQGGTSSGAFSWRVVAKPNVGEKVARMPKYAPAFDAVALKKQALATAHPPKKE